MTDIVCPREKSSMTPCIVRDGSICLTDPPQPVCVGCGILPQAALHELVIRYEPARADMNSDVNVIADRLREHVTNYLEGKQDG
ncbi:MAG TPA: hypothetical protein VK735_39880 [Pseudonocardia sp.]|uniref:hypothetical protein n=1 Tax=Pseudonocardia sp. TaxID=60912 RepID=UPI002C97A216|nr:hypothetical protein [Pseudonocardia sp.]HTF53644.1 hypothetical protein [Pseudonocardia sp.]